MIQLIAAGLAAWAWVANAHSFALYLHAHAPQEYAQPLYNYAA
jgi:hypothetical protein